MTETELPQLYFEDLEAGQVFRSDKRILMDAQSIKEFAARYDPQPFHLDEEAAKDTIFGGLAASGWHTAAVTMRMLVDGSLQDRKSTRLNSSHVKISYAVFCLK